MFAQGELLIFPIQKFPENIQPTNPEPHNNHYIIGHSETGHHHVIDAASAQVFALQDDNMTLFVNVQCDTSVRHLRSFDTHKPIHLKAGRYEVRKQREHTPEGWRQVQD